MNWFFPWRRLPPSPPWSHRRAAGSCRSSGRSVVPGCPWWVRPWSGGGGSWTPPSGGTGRPVRRAVLAPVGSLAAERPPRAGPPAPRCVLTSSTDVPRRRIRWSIVCRRVTDMSRRVLSSVMFPRFTADAWTVRLPGISDWQQRAALPTGTRWWSRGAWSCSPSPSRAWRPGLVPPAWRDSPGVARPQRPVHPGGPSLLGADRAHHRPYSSPVQPTRCNSRAEAPR
jgi:hypothetical protein